MAPKTKNASETNGDKQKREKAEPNLALHLGPFNDVIRKTMDQILGTQAAIYELNTQFSQYINHVEVLPRIQEQHETMKMQLLDKDADITRLHNALDVLTERSSEKDRALEEKEKNIEAQRHDLEKAIRKLNSDKAEWNKRSKVLEAEQKLASVQELEKLRDEIKKDQKQREADLAEKLTNLETRNESLSERVKQLDIDLLQSRDKYNEKKNLWKSVTLALNTEKQKLKAKVDEVQRELAFETRPTEY
jgi:chromosome segregation ATPase